MSYFTFLILNQVFGNRCLFCIHSTFHFIHVSPVPTATCGCWWLTDSTDWGGTATLAQGLESGTGKVHVPRGKKILSEGKQPSKGRTDPGNGISGFQLHGSPAPTTDFHSSCLRCLLKFKQGETESDHVYLDCFLHLSNTGDPVLSTS